MPAKPATSVRSSKFEFEFAERRPYETSASTRIPSDRAEAGALAGGGQDDRLAERRGGGLVEQDDDARGVFHELRADALGGFAPLIDQVIVGAIAFELVVERGGREPAAEDLPPRDLRAAEPDRLSSSCCSFCQACRCARMRRVGAGRARIERRQRLCKRGAIARIERAADGNRQPLVPLEQALVLEVAAVHLHPARLALEQLERLADVDGIAAVSAKGFIRDWSGILASS